MSNYLSLNEVKVGLRFAELTIPVGRLAIRNSTIYFQYQESFLDHGFEISPLKLPLERGLLSFKPSVFDGLPGVFNDSLPDGWGRLLFDRWVRSKNLLPQEFTPLDRLAHVGVTGLGALTYEPDYGDEKSEEVVDLELLANQAQQVLDGESVDVLAKLIALNGSSAGARPKALIGVDRTKDKIIFGTHDLTPEFEHWIVKFPNANDGVDAGAIEYVYALMAKAAGIGMAETHLFKAAKSAGYFSTTRFDRHEGKRLHMHTASGLLHSDFKIPSLDYRDLLALTEALTKDAREVEKMFRLAVFNILAHNRDDHGKNFSYLMDEYGEWKLSPAYDLTFSSGPRGHQSTMVMGEGQAPKVAQLIALGKESALGKSEIQGIIDQTKSALDQWEELAKNYGVKPANIKLIKNRINQQFLA
jgi:serine/threonine-protein kinase HipA